MPIARSIRAMTHLPAAFRRLAGSNLAAQLSEQVALSAAPLVAVLLLGAGAAETAYLQSAQTLPFLLLSLPAGVLADRASRRRLMVGAEALRAISLFGILALILAGGLGLGTLALLGCLGAVGTVAYSVAAPALLPSIVPRERLAAANGWLELARSAAFAAGPALGGAIVGWTGAPAAYVVATTLSLLAVVLLAGLPEPVRPVGPRRRLGQELAEGARFVASHALLRPILVTAVFFNTSWFILQAVYVPYAVHRLGLDAAGVGLTLGVYGAGMVAGALAAPRIARFVSFGAMVALGPLSALIAALLMAATLLAPTPLLAGAGFFLFGAGPILWTITTTTLRQAVAPGPLLGRVSAVVMTATYGARPIGAAIGALVATRYGVEACLLASAAGFLVQFLVISASPVPRLAALPAG
jgi:predicted MFS family arabinose efflux permease